MCNFNAFVGGYPALVHLVRRIAHPQQKPRPNPFAAGRQHIHRKPGAVFKAATIGGGQLVGQRRQELVHQMAVTFKLYPVQTSGLHPFGGIGVIGDNPCNFIVFDDFRKRPVRRFPIWPGGNNRQPVTLGPMRAAAQMRQLDHHRTALFVAIIGDFAHPAHHLVLVGQHIVEHRRAVARHRCRPRRHGQRHARLGPFDVIGAVAVFGHAILGVGGFVAGGHDPVFQGQVFQLIGL